MTTSEFKHQQAVLRGRQSRASGAAWEDMISCSCEFYRENRIAEIDKTPEAFKVLKSLGNGRFEMCFTKSAQPDYKGTMAGGVPLCFEAKHTDKDRLLQSAVTEEQAKCLNRHQYLGAKCFVLVSFGFRTFKKVPWIIFKNMKSVLERKYITAEDLPEFDVKCVNGIIRFLG